MELSVAACSRHWRGHVRPLLKAAAPDLHLTTFAQRLLTIADEAADLRQGATAPTVALAAMRTEREALAELTGRLGFDDTEAIEDLRVWTQAARALAGAIRACGPAVAEQIAAQLDATRDAELAELADVLRDNARDDQLAVATATTKEIQ